MASSLVFHVRRSEPVLVTPARPTRHEFKPLSDVDDLPFFHHHLAAVCFFANEPSMEGRDPVTVIRDALAELLVYYYPLAGRLRELPDQGKIVVDCTAEGVLFVEADADVRLDQLGDDPLPPFPYMEEFLRNVGGSDAIFHSPLLLFQLTRLQCGGYVFAFQFNHTIMDGYGAAQFLTSLGEMARGADAPTVPPVWERERLAARIPPRVAHPPPNLDLEVSDYPPDQEAVLRSFFFGQREVSALRKRLPPQLRGSTRFELVTACVWRSRTIAFGLGPDEQASIVFNINARSKCHPPLPAGYYGNAFAPVLTQCTAGELCRSPLEHALLLVRKAKETVTGGYLQSMVDLVSLAGRMEMTAQPFIVSDVKHAGYNEVDFGLGKAAFGGPPYLPGKTNSFHYRHRNSKGEEGIVVMLCLPAPVMEKFAVEMEGVNNESPNSRTTATSRIRAAL